MSKSQITNERREKNKEKKRRKRFFIYFFGGILAFVFILGLTISPALGSSSNSSKISGGGVNLEGPADTDKEDKRKEIGIGEPHDGYSLAPPTSGAYWYDLERPVPGVGVTSPAPWGKYETQISVQQLSETMLDMLLQEGYIKLDKDDNLVKVNDEVVDDSSPVTKNS